MNRVSIRWKKERIYGECIDGDVKRSVINDGLVIYVEIFVGWYKMKNLYDIIMKMFWRLLRFKVFSYEIRDLIGCLLLSIGVVLVDK